MPVLFNAGPLPAPPRVSEKSPVKLSARVEEFAPVVAGDARTVQLPVPVLMSPATIVRSGVSPKYFAVPGDVEIADNRDGVKRPAFSALSEPAEPVEVGDGDVGAAQFGVGHIVLLNASGSVP